LSCAEKQLVTVLGRRVIYPSGISPKRMPAKDSISGNRNHTASFELTGTKFLRGVKERNSLVDHAVRNRTVHLDQTGGSSGYQPPHYSFECAVSGTMATSGHEKKQSHFRPSELRLSNSVVQTYPRQKVSERPPPRTFCL
jgi:hypothetical protein